MTEKLKLCPFCGSKNVDIFPTFGDGESNQNLMNVECIDCGAQGAVRLGEQKAVEAWNKRSVSSEAKNGQLLEIVRNLAESNTYPQAMEVKQAAKKLMQSMVR